ncbi:MAG: aminotransferase class I/II-fold pyridoxal phosphate-dependent enzyme [Candidatus Electrothrix scaldis]|nr:MAG: aminotransferase class I/II-fold pyridoxal phosphate-dependent enzyme [Candidatus Electrothrix sp. GW3-3]
MSSHPSYLKYQKFVQVRGGTNVVIPLKDMVHDLEAIAAAVTEPTKLIFLDNPNNPCATLVSKEDFAAFLCIIRHNYGRIRGQTTFTSHPLFRQSE